MTLHSPIARQDGWPSTIVGMGLLEWVVALGLNALVLLILTQALLSARVSFSMIDATARLSDNGRFALAVIAESLNGASAELPCAREQDNPLLRQVSFIHPSPGFVPEAMVVGWEAPNTQGAAWSLHAELEKPFSTHVNLPPALNGRVDPQSDVLMVHYRAPVSGVMVNDLRSDQLLTQQGHGLKSCSLVVMSDCTTDYVFQASQATIRSVHWSSDGVCEPGNEPIGAIDVNQWPDGRQLALYHWHAMAWFVGPPEDGERTLYRALFDRGQSRVRVEAMVEGIETLQVQFASRSSIEPMEWRSASGVSDWSSVVGVRLGVLASARMDPHSSKADGWVSQPLLGSEVAWPAGQGYVDSFQTAKALRGAQRVQR